MNSYIHSKTTYKSNLLLMILLLIPLILYGIYKNGFLLYQKELISFLSMFKPLILCLISILIYEIFCLITKRKLSFDYNIYSLIIVSIIMPQNINYYIFIIGLIIAITIDYFLSKKFNYNKIAFIKLLIILLCLIFSNYGYENFLEAKNNYAFNYLDYLAGREIGGIANTSIILSLAIFFIMCYKTIYKKIIPIISFGIYLLGSLLITIITKDFNFVLLFNANIIFALIFVATEITSTPYINKKLIIYSISLGILTLLFSYIINVYEGVFIAIIVMNFTSNLLNFKKNKKNIGILAKNTL